jgi:hypothetical protein
MIFDDTSKNTSFLDLVIKIIKHVFKIYWNLLKYFSALYLDVFQQKHNKKLPEAIFLVVSDPFYERTVSDLDP